jgi:hypothetical protein
MIGILRNAADERCAQVPIAIHFAPAMNDATCRIAMSVNAASVVIALTQRAATLKNKVIVAKIVAIGTETQATSAMKITGGGLSKGAASGATEMNGRSTIVVTVRNVRALAGIALADNKMSSATVAKAMTTISAANSEGSRFADMATPVAPIWLVAGTT